MSGGGPSPLDPPLPFTIGERAPGAVRDIPLRQKVSANTRSRDRERVRVCDEAFGERYDDLRRLAGRIKQHALDHLDEHLARFEAQAKANGIHVHHAADGAAACAAVAAIARRHGLTRCVKSKSMVTEEIRLNAALEAAGIEAVETDLGEFVLQIDDDAPSHIVAPMIHKDRAEVGRAFERVLGVPYEEDPARLTKIARAHLRGRYRAADLGVSGANFLVAETGTVVVCTNEGNADLAMAVPRVHVVCAGIEKIVPRMEQLPLFLKLLARSATGQPITVYTTLVSGPRSAADHDGPEEVHVVLLDGGRRAVLESEARELLRCIRCGACLNACPVYRTVGGGHAYGAVYSGPIGAVLMPRLKGVQQYPDLAGASSLCGACREACPVDIDIPGQLVRLRAEARRRRLGSRGARLAMKAWAFGARHPRLMGVAQRVGTWWLRRRATADGTGRRWIERASGPLSAWTKERDLLVPARRSFRSWWREREGRGP